VYKHFDVLKVSCITASVGFVLADYCDSLSLLVFSSKLKTRGMTYIK
jgi:hypothetical protein